MPIDAATPLFPPHEPLARFFAADPRKPVPLSRVAGLLGITTETLRARLDSEGGRRRSNTLPWAEAAGYLFDAWPRARLLETLGPAHARRVPEQFHPTRVPWSVPLFIVRAMEHQADARGVDDYVADLLFNEIQPQTVIAFRDDPAFLAAYHYPFPSVSSVSPW
jgi:hypothetical protein